MSLTPIYDDLLRQFEGIILVSEAAEAVQTAAAVAEATVETATEAPDEHTSGDVLDAS
ncbi:hypothetical protein [Saccharothrix sp. ALI-22-I]|uniref:hypothetical protein n=1 Tax=Saccharothrix sp. ALI-22-I TaxID=1933778 RepID=UPI0015C3D7DA|nr:hypothetical protein [Saccharothrix sp. ALI-22-I]